MKEIVYVYKCSVIFFPGKKCTDLQMNKEQFDFAFFLSCQLPMREGRLEDIGTTCLLFTIEKLPS